MIKLKVLVLSSPYFTNISINTNVKNKCSYENLHLIMKEIQSKRWIHLYLVLVYII